MATTTTITALTALAGGSLATDDVLAVVDVSDTTQAATGTTKKITVASLMTLPSVLKLADGTAGAPGLAFASDTDSGVYRIGTNNIGVAVNGAKVVDVATTGLSVTGTITGSSGLAIGGALTGATTGAFSGAITVGGGVTVGAGIEVTAGIVTLAAGLSVTGGTGAFAGAVTVGGTLGVTGTLTAGNVAVGGTLGVTGATTLTGGVASDILFGTDNTYDIGADGANRPSNIYAAGAVAVSGNITTASSVGIVGHLEVGVSPAQAGIIRIPNNNAICARNAADSDDIQLIYAAADGQVQITSDGGGTVVGGALSVTGALTFATDNSVDIGASGAHRPANVYVAKGVTVPHIVGAGSAPSVVGSGGTSPSANVTVGSTDLAGTVNFTTGSGTVTLPFFTVTFATAYASAPKAIVITNANANASPLQGYISSVSTTTFTWSISTALAASTQYSFKYVVIG